MRADLLAFIAWRAKSGRSPALRRASCLAFAAFIASCCARAPLHEDPTLKIDMPKIGRALPQSLTESEVESLLGAPDTADPIGHRDRAMLEVLYATGLRVSELINLRQGQINLNQGVLRIGGKGDRERLIPLGEEAQDWIREFVAARAWRSCSNGRPNTCSRPGGAIA